MVVIKPIEPSGQPAKSLKLTVLFCWILAWVLYELGHQGEDETIFSHQRCFQDAMII